MRKSIPPTAGAFAFAAVVTACSGATVESQDRRAMTTEADFRSAMETLSNWGRWGDDDELGAANLITPEKRTEAAALAPRDEASQWRTTSSRQRPLRDRGIWTGR